MQTDVEPVIFRMRLVDVSPRGRGLKLHTEVGCAEHQHGQAAEQNVQPHVQAAHFATRSLVYEADSPVAWIS